MGSEGVREGGWDVLEFASITTTGHKGCPLKSFYSE